jgi:hypothetical protein
MSTTRIVITSGPNQGTLTVPQAISPVAGFTPPAPPAGFMHVRVRQNGRWVLLTRRI